MDRQKQRGDCRLFSFYYSQHARPSAEKQTKTDASVCITGLELRNIESTTHTRILSLLTHHPRPFSPVDPCEHRDAVPSESELA